MKRIVVLLFKLNYNRSIVSALIMKCHLPSMTKRILPNVCLNEKYNYGSKLSNHSPLSIFHLIDRLPKGSFPVPNASFLWWEWSPKWSTSVEEVRGFVNDDIQVIRKTWGVELLYKMVSKFKSKVLWFRA